MKKIEIQDKESWKNLPKECQGGLCVYAGSNLDGFEINHKSRLDKYICFYFFESKNIL